jgi:ketosteroid isomerase-like protein
MTNIEAALRPVDVPGAFALAFNSGDLAAVSALYEEGAVLVAGDDRREMRDDDLTGAVAEHMALGLPIDVNPRRVIVNGELALLLVDWMIAGTLPDGAVVEITGTATDVARRGDDGRWRYVIDNPFGIA